MMEIEAIQVPFNGNSIKIISVEWSDDKDSVITVSFRKTGEIAKLVFTDAAGIRLLHELDLAGWWMNAKGSALSESWLFRVKSGGWFDSESKRDDFYMKHETNGVREYLITGYQECVSVFAYTEPMVHIDGQT